MNTTPSERAYSEVSSFSSSSGANRSESTTLLWLKNIFGSPVPVFLVLYAISLLTSMSGMEIFGWGAGIFTLIYILLDRVGKNREFRFFFVGGDQWLIGLLIVGALGLLINAPYVDFWSNFSQLRWILLLYLLSYSLYLFPGINRYFTIITVVAVLVGLYGIVQHFTGIDLRVELGIKAKSVINSDAVKGMDNYQVIGFFGHHLTYGYLFVMILCIPFASLIVAIKEDLDNKWIHALTSAVIGASVVLTFGRGVWLSLIVSFLFMTIFLSKRLFFGAILIIGLAGGTLYGLSPTIQKRVDKAFNSDSKNTQTRMKLWDANLEMLSDNPWLGVGVKQNENLVFKYYERLGIDSSFRGHAHNTYLQWLSTTGILGFAFYMLFSISFLLMTYRLWSIIPSPHLAHRTFVLAILGAQIAMHAGGLTQWNFGDGEVNHAYIFLLAILSYMNHRYSDSIVSDDRSL